MKNSLFITFCLILIQPLFAWSNETVGSISTNATEVAPSHPSRDRFKAEWRLRLGGADIRDESQQSKTVTLRADVKSRYTLLPKLQLDFQPSISLETGQRQTTDGANESDNRLYLNQAAAHYSPTGFLRFSAGALNQRYSHAHLLVDNIAFPAVRAEMLSRLGSFRLGAAAETAIPTSTSMSTNTKDLEETPSLHSAQLKMIFAPNRKTYWKNSVGYFVFQNLPSAVAHQSRLLGNDVLQISEAQYSFIYKFAGIEVSSEFNFEATSYLDFNGYAEYLQNLQAPAGLNQAYNVGLAGTVKTSANTKVSLGLSHFRVEPEAAVSYFNASVFETNRVGYSLDSYISFRKEGFKLGARFIDSQVIYLREPQSREKTLLLMLETFYASI